MKHYGLLLNSPFVFYILKDNNNIFTASLIELKEEIAEYQRKYMMETVSFTFSCKLYNLAEIFYLPKYA